MFHDPLADLISAGTCSVEELDALNERAYDFDLIGKAVRNGNFEHVKWLRKNKYSYNVLSLVDAVKAGNFEIVKWMVFDGAPEEEDAFKQAVRRNHFQIVEWMWERGVSNSTSLVALAAEHGHLDLLKWMHVKKFPADQGAFHSAAYRGRLNVMQWLLKQGYPHDEFTFSKAIFHGNLTNVQWMYDQDVFEYSVDAVKWAVKKRHFHIMEWMLSVSFPVLGQSSRIELKRMVQMHRARIIHRMISSGADVGQLMQQSLPSAFSSEDSPIHTALQKNGPACDETVLWLMGLGCNFGRKELVVARKLGKYRLIKRMEIFTVMNRIHISKCKFK